MLIHKSLKTVVINTVCCLGLVFLLTATGQAADSGSGTKTNVVAKKGTQSPGIQDVTYASLLALKSASSLSIGQRYRITDFQTIHVVTWDQNGVVLHTGTKEPLIVTAETGAVLAKTAISEAYPEDVIHYTLVKYTYNGNGGGGHKGIITYRWEPERNIEAHFDWRNSRVRLWEESPGSGKWVPDPDRPDTLAYKDFSFWEPQGAGQTIEDIHVGSTNAASVARVVFMGNAAKVRIEDATDPVIFMKDAWDVQISSCASLVAYEEVDNVVILGGIVTAKKNLFQVLFGPEAGGTYEGAIRNCQVFAGWVNDGKPVEGDRTGELIGYPKGK